MQTAFKEEMCVKCLALCLVHFKCPIKVDCYHGYLPMYKGNLVTAVSFSPCFSKAAPFLPPHVGAMLGLSTQVLSRKWPKLKCTIYKPTSLLKTLAWPRGRAWSGGKTGETHPLFPSPRGSLVDDSLVQWPYNSLRDWRGTGPISSAFMDSITEKHPSLQTISRYQTECLLLDACFICWHRFCSRLTGVAEGSISMMFPIGYLGEKGFKDHKFIILKFCRLQVPHGSH